MEDTMNYKTAISAAFLMLSAQTQLAAAETLRVNCLANSQWCSENKLYTFQSESIDYTYSIKIKTATSHCSDVKFHILSGDGTIEYGTTPWLAAGQLGIVPIGNNLARGAQVVQIRTLGRRGGCNTGRIGSWQAQVWPLAE